MYLYTLNHKRLNTAPVITAVISVISVLIFIGCATTREDYALKRFEFIEPAMGTLWKITMFAPNEEIAKKAAKAAFARVRDFDARFSDFNQESELNQLCYKSGKEAVAVSDDLFDIIKLSLEISKKTEGAFDITASPYIQLWRRAARHREAPSPERLAQAKRLVGYDKIQLDEREKTVLLKEPGMRLDLGGIAKGYAAERALKILRAFGITRALVAGSGDLAIGEPPPGKKGWRVEIGSGDSQTNRLSFTLELKNCGVSTSGDVELWIELNGIRYSHIVDPRTGIGLTNRIQATVIADRASRSDPLATAMCVSGVEKGLKLIEADRTISALFIKPDGTNRVIIPSSRFPKFIQK